MTPGEPPAEAAFAHDAETLEEVLTALETEGFGEQLVPREGGKLRVPSRGEELDAGAAKVVAFRRLEGASDPDDMVLVAALELPSGERGVLVLGYGPNAGPADGDVLLALNLPR